MTKRIFISGFKHETNTFSQRPADLAAYRARGWHRGDQIPERFRGTRTEIAGFMDACEKYGWMPIYGTTGDATPSGPVSREAFDTITGEILAAARAAGPLDGMLLQLHGAMVAEHVEDGEGTFLALLREEFGRDLPIAVTLDLHANVTDKMAELADIIVSYRTYPHIDSYEAAREAADILARMLAGEVRPTVTVARGRLLDGVDHGRTTSPGPMREVLASAARLSKEPGVLSITINAGFPWADIRDAGPTAVVVGDGDSLRYREIAETLMAEIWESRHRRTIESVDAQAAMAAVRAAAPGKGAIVLADFADNPGGGGYGDATGLLGAMIEAGLENAAFATIYDPEAAAICHEAGAGAEVSLKLGGKVDPKLGAPLDVQGTVVSLANGSLKLDGPMAKGLGIEMGPTAVLRVGGIDIVVASGRFQALDQQYFKHAGIEPAQKSVLAVKSAQHFRAAFAPIARDIIVVDSGGGLTSNDYRAFTYARVRRPVYPLDLD
jgi:microcystin degradation protein MlrC